MPMSAVNRWAPVTGRPRLPTGERPGCGSDMGRPVPAAARTAAQIRGSRRSGRGCRKGRHRPAPGRPGVGLQEGRGRHDHPGMQNPHWTAPWSRKTLLKRGQPVGAQTLDGGDLTALGLDGEHQTGIHRDTVEQHVQAPHSPSAQHSLVPVSSKIGPGPSREESCPVVTAVLRRKPLTSTVTVTLFTMLSQTSPEPSPKARRQWTSSIAVGSRRLRGHR